VTFSKAIMLLMPVSCRCSWASTAAVIVARYSSMLDSGFTCWALAPGTLVAFG